VWFFGGEVMRRVLFVGIDAFHGATGRCSQLKDEGAKDTLRRTGVEGRGVVPVNVGKVGGVDRSILCDELRHGIFLDGTRDGILKCGG
jgi:hypothetical protein